MLPLIKARLYGLIVADILRYDVAGSSLFLCSFVRSVLGVSGVEHKKFNIR